MRSVSDETCQHIARRDAEAAEKHIWLAFLCASARNVLVLARRGVHGAFCFATEVAVIMSLHFDSRNLSSGFESRVIRAPRVWTVMPGESVGIQ
jgi:hypothetical protein